jgi:hypothetical protein
MQVAILAGGFGTRLSEETNHIPKPMMEIGGKPILWHIMNIYSQQGFDDFIIMLGYKGYIIKEYFANYFLHQSDISIDLKNKRIKVSGAVVPDENNNLVKKATNKTASSTRHVPIFIPELAEALEKAIKDHRLNDPITLMTHNTMYDRINTVCERNELPRVGVHGLRHSFASLAYSLGVPELVAMQIGGWSDYGTMRKIYTHIAESQRTKNVDKLRLFFEKNTADC